MNARKLVPVLFAGFCSSCLTAGIAVAGDVPAQPAPAAAETAAAEEDFASDVRAMLRDLVGNDALEALRDSPVSATDAIVVRPFPNDRKGYVRDLLKTAVTDSGRQCVEAADDMWEDVMKEIGWNQGFADILDAGTMTRLGRLLPARLLLYGTLRLDKTAKGRPEAELSLHVCDLETRRHVWGKTLRRPKDKAPAPAVPAGTGSAFIREADCGAADLSVAIVSTAADDTAADLAAELLSVARETVGGRGFQITEDPKGADVAVRLAVSQSAFDRTGESVVMEGGVRVEAVVPARKDYFLAETRFDRIRAERQLGDRAATLALRDLVAPKLVSWLGENVTVEKTGLEAARLVCDVSRLDADETAKFASDFCRTLAKTDGVCACRLLSETDDEAVFRVAFLPKELPEGVINAVRVRFPQLFADVEPVR